MRLRSTFTTALALAALTATPSLAAGKVPPKVPPKPKVSLPVALPLVWTDPAGDANGLNNQGGLVPAGPNSTVTPGSRSADDLLSVTMARLDDGKAVTGLVVTMKLSGAPAAGALYRVTGAAAGCTTFWFQYSWTVGGTAVASLRHNCGVAAAATPATAATATILIDGKVVDNSIVWTVPLALLPTGITLGTVLSPALGEVRFLSGAAGQAALSAPIVDQTEVQTATYKIGQ